MKKYAIAIMFILYLMFIAGCGASQEIPREAVNINSMGEEAIITEFWYSSLLWDTGKAFGVLADSDGDLRVNYLNFGLGGINDVCIPLTQEKYRGLANIVKEYDLKSWDGWGQDEVEEDKIILSTGGGGFRLEIKWSDGKSIMAKKPLLIEGEEEAYVPYPENFEKVDSAISRFFDYYWDDWKKVNNIE